MSSILANEQKNYDDITLKTLSSKKEEGQTLGYHQAWWDIFHAVFLFNPGKFSRKDKLEVLKLYKEQMWDIQVFGDGIVEIDKERGSYNFKEKKYNINKEAKISETIITKLDNYIKIFSDEKNHTESELNDDNFIRTIFYDLFNIKGIQNFEMLFQKGQFRFFYYLNYIGITSNYETYLKNIMYILQTKNINLTQSLLKRYKDDVYKDYI